MGSGCHSCSEVAGQFILRVQYISRPRLLPAPAYWRLYKIPNKSDFDFPSKKTTPVNKARIQSQFIGSIFAPICIKRKSGLATHNEIAHCIAFSLCIRWPLRSDCANAHMNPSTRLWRLTGIPDYSSGFAPQIPEANRLEAMDAKLYSVLVQSMILYSYEYIRINIDTHSRFAGNIQITLIWNFPLLGFSIKDFVLYKPKQH